MKNIIILMLLCFVSLFTVSMDTAREETKSIEVDQIVYIDVGNFISPIDGIINNDQTLLKSSQISSLAYDIERPERATTKQPSEMYLKKDGTEVYLQNLIKNSYAEADDTRQDKKLPEIRIRGDDYVNDYNTTIDKL